jgi:hypothetical protein
MPGFCYQCWQHLVNTASLRERHMIFMVLVVIVLLDFGLLIYMAVDSYKHRR